MQKPDPLFLHAENRSRKSFSDRFLPARTLLGLCFFLVLSAFFFSPQAYALQIRKVQHVKVTLERGQDKERIGLDAAVDPSKTLVFIQIKVLTPGDADPFSTRAAAYLSGTRNLDVVRDKSDAGIEVYADVLEFKSGVKVQAGVSLFTSDQSKKSIKLPAFDNRKAVPFLMVTTRGYGGETGGEYLYFQSNLPDNTTLYLARMEAAEIPPPEDAEKTLDAPEVVVMPEVTVHWQLAEFMSEDVFVQSGIAKLPHFAKDTNSYLINAVKKIEAAMVTVDGAAGHFAGNSDLLAMVRSEMVDDNVLKFERGLKGEERGSEVLMQWYVTEFLGPFTGVVQQGTLHFEPGEPLQSIPLNSKVDPRRAFVRTSATPAVDSAMPGVSLRAQSLFAGEFSSSGDSLTLSRGREEGAKAVAADVHWEVVEFAPISLSGPNGGETWLVGDKNEISWDYSDELVPSEGEKKPEARVEIRLSLNAGVDSFPYVIAKDLPVSNGRYVWTVPVGVEGQNAIGGGRAVKVLISDLPDKNFDVSREPFQIKGVLNLVEPDGGQVWRAGEEGREIRWTYRGHLGPVRLYYDLESGYGPDPFPDYQKIAEIEPGEDGEGRYVWSPVPDVTSFRARVKVVSVDDPSVGDFSSQDLTLLPGITVLHPAEGDGPFEAEKPLEIVWRTTGTVSEWNLFYSAGDVKELWKPAAAKIPGGPAGEYSYEWLVPPDAVSEFVKIKLEKAGDPRIAVTAPGTGRGFFSVRPWIRLLVPAGSREVWNVGQTEKIMWESGGPMQYFKFEYSVDGGQSWIQDSVLNARDGQYAWTVPDRISDQVRFRLSDMKDPVLQDTSEDLLKIKGVLDLEAPSGGEVWNTADTNHEIRWKSSGTVGTVSLYYDAGIGKEGAKQIASGIPHTQGLYAWKKLPDVNSSRMRVRIVQDSDPEVYSESLEVFTIQPEIKVVAPSPDLAFFPAEKNLRLRWKTTGSLDPFAVFYQTGQDPAWVPAARDIPGGEAGEYHYDWKIPAALIGQKVRFKVVYEGKPGVEEPWYPDGEGIEVQPWVEFRKTVSKGQKLKADSLYSIEWDFAGATRFIRVDSSYDGGKKWVKEAVLPAEKRSHQWPVPARPGSRVLFRVSDLNQPEIQAVSLYPMEIES